MANSHKLVSQTDAHAPAVHAASHQNGGSDEIDVTGLTGAGGAVATDTIWDAKGDLAVGTGANTAAKLTVGANDTILMADSGETTGIKWVASQTPSTQAFGDAAAQGTADTYARGDHKHAMPAAPGILAVHAYAPASQTVYSITSATIADVDATNMVVTFTAPASGNIIVRLSAYADISAGTGDGWWGLRESTSNIAGSQVRVVRNSAAATIATALIYLTGVSAGSHTYKWAFRSASNAGDTTRIIVQDGSNGTWSAGVMVVEAAP